MCFSCSDESSSSLCEEIVDKMSFEDASQLSIIVPPSTPVVPKRKSRRRKKRKQTECNIKIITS